MNKKNGAWRISRLFPHAHILFVFPAEWSLSIHAQKRVVRSIPEGSILQTVASGMKSEIRLFLP
jgi:hypothetical protein